MYGEAIVAKQQLEAVGITVDLQVTDWATVLENAGQAGRVGHVRDRPRLRARSEPDLLRRPDERLSRLVELGEQPRAGRASCSPSRTSTPACAICEQIQAAHYTEIPAIKIGDSSNCLLPLRDSSAAGTRSSSAV